MNNTEPFWILYGRLNGHTMAITTLPEAKMGLFGGTQSTITPQGKWREPQVFRLQSIFCMTLRMNRSQCFLTSKMMTCRKGKSLDTLMEWAPNQKKMLAMHAKQNKILVRPPNPNPNPNLHAICSSTVFNNRANLKT